MPTMPSGSDASSTLTRRRLLRNAAAVAGGAVLASRLAGCGPGLVGEAIRFWNGFSGPDGRTMLQIVNRFNATGEAGQVAMQRMGWPVYYNKLFVAALGGRGPEVFVIHTDQMVRFARADLLRPVGDLLREDVLPPSDFDPGVLAAVSFNGTPYGVPLDAHPEGLYYNRAMLDTAGFSHPPRTRDEFLAATQAMTRRSGGEGGGGGRQWGFAFTWARNNAYTLCRQFGGDIVAADDPSRCILDSPENVAALEWGRDLVTATGDVPQVAPERSFDPDTLRAFRAGRVGCVLHGIFVLSALLKQEDLDWAAAPAPVLGNRRATWASSHVLCLRPDLEGQSLETAVALVKFLSNESLAWARAGQVPVRQSLRATDEFSAMPAQSAFAEQMDYLAYQPQVPFANEAADEFELAVDMALRGSASAEAALAASAVSLRRTIERYLEAGWDPTDLRSGVGNGADQ